MDYPKEEAAAKASLQAIARDIASALPSKEWGFILLVFALSPPKERDMLYVAKAQRSDAIQAMREFIAKQTREAFGTDAGETGEEGFRLWWEGQLKRYPPPEGLEAEVSEKLREWCFDAFIAGMIWQPEE